MVLDRLPRPHSARMVEHVAGGNALPANVMHQIVEHTDGVPLFIEEMTKAVVESVGLQEQEDRVTPCQPWPFPPRCTTA